MKNISIENVKEVVKISKNIKQAYKTLGIARDTFNKFCKLNNISFDHFDPYFQRRQVKRQNRICLFCNTNFSCTPSSKKLFCTTNCANKSKTEKTRYKQSQTLKQFYIKNPRSRKEKIKHICGVCGNYKGSCKRPDICKHVQLIETLISYFGFNKSVLGTERVYEEYERIKNLIYEDYWNQKLSISDLIKKYSYYNNTGNFLKILDCLEIERRSLSDAGRLAILQDKYGIRPSFVRCKCGYHTTWNNKIVFYRSSYELEQMEIYDKQQIEYRVESLRILYFDTQKCIQRVAIPDFYLPTTNEIVEIKGMYFYDEQNMKDKFKAYIEHGYTPKLILEKTEVKLENL